MRKKYKNTRHIYIYIYIFACKIVNCKIIIKKIMRISTSYQRAVLFNLIPSSIPCRQQSYPHRV